MALLLHLWAQYASFWILAQMVQTAWAHHHCWPIFEVYDNSCNKQTNKQTNDLNNSPPGQVIKLIPTVPRVALALLAKHSLFVLILSYWIAVHFSRKLRTELYDIKSHSNIQIARQTCRILPRSDVM